MANVGSDIKCLEHPTLKVPYEILNKKFRTAQKNIDREVLHVQSSANELEKCLQKGSTLPDITQTLTGIVEKLTLMKRKAEESMQEELNAAKICKRRIEHLRESESLSPTTVNLWRKKRLDRMLVEYFLRSGCYNTAVKLAEHAELQDLTNIDLFLVAHEIEESLLNHETAKCLSWCYENKSKLRKSKSTLEFNLRQQEFVELIKTGQRMEAVRHARKHFVGVEDYHLGDVQKSMGLLAFSPDSPNNPYKELLSPSRWQSLAQQFRQENYSLYQLCWDSMFVVTLQAGLSAIKTPHCYKDNPNSKNPSCPTCNKYFNSLARRLPFSHCSQSKLICSISGQSLNEHNIPMMLPNGYVYGYKALNAMATENNGKVTCPKTKEVYSLQDAEKVFVM